MSSPRRIGAILRPGRLLVASLLLMISLGLLGAGVAGLLLSGDNGPKLTTVGVADPIETSTITVPTPTPSAAPVARLIIEKIGVDAPVVTMGVDEDGIPQVPDNPYDVVWYNFSSKPGWGSNAVFAGHYDWTVNHQGVAGVFYNLRQLGVGDIVEVRLEDGTDYKYSIIGNLAIKDGDPQAMQMMAPTSTDMVTLITCGGVWTPDPSNPLGGNYDYRQFVRAQLIGGGAPTEPDEGNIGQPRREDSPG